MVERVHGCGKAVGAAVGLHRAADGAHLSGTATCGSVHSCPRCAPVIRQARAVELGDTIERWIANGGRVYFVTLTAPHTIEDRLEASLDALGESWRHLWSRRPRERLDAACGVREGGDEHPWVGMVRSIDITHGQHGWHPHYHCVVFVGAWVGQSMIDRYVIDAWLHGTGMAGRPAVRAACHSVELVAGTGFAVAAYTLDATAAAMDVMRLDTKKAGAGSSPWQLLGQAVDGETSGRALWAEYSRTMHGRRSAVWSRRLRQWARSRDLVDERTDDELADGNLVGAVLLATIDNSTYGWFRRRGITHLLLESVENGTWQNLLSDLGFAWHDPPD